MGKLNNEQVNELCNLYQQGMSSIKLSKKYNITTNAIFYFLKKNKIPARPIKKLNKEQVQQICNSYCDGRSILSLSKQFNVCHGSITYLLKRNNISIRITTKLTKEQREEICDLYKKGYNSTQLSKQFNVSQANISGILRRRNVKSRDNSTRQRRYKLNETIFNSINEESAYWVGFIMADGCVMSERRELIIRLSVRDKDHLIKFQQFLKSNIPVKCHKRYGKTSFSNGKDVASITACSSIIVNSLSKYGVAPRKSLTAKVKLLENNKHYWRGMIDGDGSVMITNKGYPRIFLCGSYDTIYQFKQFTKTTNKIIQKDKIYAIFITGKRAGEIIKNLYKDATVYLDRKMKRASQWF